VRGARVVDWATDGDACPGIDVFREGWHHRFVRRSFSARNTKMLYYEMWCIF